MNKFNNKTMIIPIALASILLVLFYNADSRLEQLMIGLIFIMNFIPLTIHLFTMLLFTAAPKPAEERIAENIIKNSSNNKEKVGIKQTYKAKTNNNPNYINLRSRLISIMKNGELDRDNVLKFKLELDNRLGVNRYEYSNFSFENDMHEIYTKLKSSKLTDQDYLHLKGVIEDLVG